MRRPYDAGDAAALWEGKQAYELELGTGDDETVDRYHEKLDAEHRESHLRWSTSVSVQTN